MKTTIAAALRWLHRIENGFLVGLVVLALGLATAQIVLRNSGGTALVWADQALNILVLWIAMAGALVASRERNHIAIDVVSHYTSPYTQRFIDSIIYLTTSLVCAVAAYYGIGFVIEERQYPQEVIPHIPNWVCVAIIPFALGVIALRYLLFFLQSLLPVKAR
ncbi:MAG: TRAP transporter small permease [Pseudomonadales bacterium]